MDSPLPYLGFGLGLRTPHYDTILATRPQNVDWFEIISENFIDAHQGYHEFLQDLRRDYPIVMHGVSLNIGSPDPLNKPYLAKLKSLANTLECPWFSDHLCWTGVNARNTHDLLPLPYTRGALAHVVDRAKKVQDIVGRPFALENPSSYLEFKESRLPEWEFLLSIAERANCKILLDVNNIYVSAFNHGFDAHTYIDAIPAKYIAQIHLAGHHDYGTHIIDTHDNVVVDAVWDLYRYTIASKGMISTMIEWDDQIPAFDVLAAELDKARAVNALLPQSFSEGGSLTKAVVVP